MDEYNHFGLDLIEEGPVVPNQILELFLTVGKLPCAVGPTQPENVQVPVVGNRCEQPKMTPIKTVRHIVLPRAASQSIRWGRQPSRRSQNHKATVPVRQDGIMIHDGSIQ
jgi:hypothetical protein